MFSTEQRKLSPMNNKKAEDRAVSPARVTYEVKADDIVFQVEGEGRPFQIDREAFLCLLNNDRMQELFRLAKKPSEQYAELDNTEFIARLYRLMKKGLGVSKCAEFLGVDDGKLRHFYSYCAANYFQHISAQLAQEIERQGEKEKDYCQAIPNKQIEKECRIMGISPPTDLPSVFVNASNVKQHLRCGKNIEEIARGNNLSLKDFSRWLDKNKPILEVL